MLRIIQLDGGYMLQKQHLGKFYPLVWKPTLTEAIKARHKLANMPLEGFICAGKEETAKVSQSRL